jgi:protein gp37
MGKTSIEWTDRTWSPIRVRVKADAAAIAHEKGYTSLVSIAERMVGRVGPHCEHVSPGCENCYAGTNNRRCLPSNGTGLPYDRRSRDLVEAFVDERILLEPLKWKEPQRIFVENQSDLLGEWVADEMLDRVFAVMALCPHHTFQILTKRPERMLQYCSEAAITVRIVRNAILILETLNARREQSIQRDWSDPLWHRWPYDNVHLGVSCENQETADKRIPLLLQTPAAVRFISAEPLLGPLDLRQLRYMNDEVECEWNALTAYHEVLHSNSMDICATAEDGVTKLDWVIAGGESGPGARPCNADWIRGIALQCKGARVPVFVKQLGGRPTDRLARCTSYPVPGHVWTDEGGGSHFVPHLKDKKGGDWNEWPEDLRVREFPK